MLTLFVQHDARRMDFAGSTMVMEVKTDARKVVLVVDDEALVRINAVDMFEDMGFEVLEAANGNAALAILEARPDVDLLFSDCRMPGMSGPELAETASRRWPRLKVVLVSGYVAVRPTEWPLVPKPYDTKTIEKIVATVASRA